MKLLIVGGNGQVGFELRRSLLPLGEVRVATRQGGTQSDSEAVAMDLSSESSVLSALDAIQPDVVVNAAAYTAVDQAETDTELAMQVNGHAVGVMAEWCAQHSSKLVHYSTDYVFNGEATTPYEPDAPTNPINAYGASKKLGETLVQQAGCDHLVFRTSWVYGSRGKNFMNTMLRLAADRDALSIVADQIGAPTAAFVIADATAHAIRIMNAEAWPAAKQGIHHLTCQDHTSWAGFAEAIFAEATAVGVLEREPTVQHIPSSDYPTPAKRPSYSCLDVGSFEANFVACVPWRDALRVVMAS